MNARVFLIMVLMVSASMVAMLGPSERVGAAEEVTSDIEIDGDGELVNCTYITGGSGTYFSPYIISDLEMGSNGFKISNNTFCLAFMNITFTEGEDYCFKLYLARGITIKNISVTGSRKFLKAEKSQNTYVTESTFTNAPSGRRTIENIDSAGTSLISNSFSSFGNSEMFFHKGSGPVIRGNTFVGISIVDTEYTGYDDISFNEFNNSQLVIKNSSNYPSISDNSFNCDYGYGLTLDNCREINVHNNSFTAPIGIFFPVTYFTYGDLSSAIYDCIFEDCGVGIGGEDDYTACSRPSGFEIRDNLFLNSTGHAINLCGGRYNTVYRNQFIDNNGVKDNPEKKQCIQLLGGVFDFVPKWDKNGEGNYWSDQTGPDADSNGKVDKEYPIAYMVNDDYPCANRFFDYGKPNIDLQQPDEDTGKTSYLEMRWDADDEHSGLEELTLTANGEELNVMNQYSCRIFLEEGTHKIILTGKDKAGLVNSSDINIVVQRTNEVIKVLNYGSDDIVSKDAPELIWEVQRYFPVSKQTITINGVPETLDPETRKYTLDLLPGKNEVTLTVDDGNFVERSLSLILIKDTQAPTINVVSPEPGMTYSNNLLSTVWTISDNLKLDRTVWKIDDREWVNSPTEMIGYTEVSDGDHILVVRAVDNAGLTTEVEIQFVVGTDNGLEIVSPLDRYETKSEYLDLIWTYDGDFNVVRSMLRIGINSDFIEIGQDCEGIKISNYARTVYDGEYTVTVRLYDESENYIETSRVIIIDTTAPRILFENIPGFPNIGTSEINLKWKGYEENTLTSYRLKVDEGEWLDTDMETSMDLTLGDGEHVISVEVKDLAGNKDVYSLELNVDATPPEVHILSPASNDILMDGFVDLEWDVSEKGKIIKALVLLNGMEIRNATGLTRRSFIIEEEGEHSISLVVWDESGNVGSDEITVTSDNEPAKVVWTMVPTDLSRKMDQTIEWSYSDTIGVRQVSLSLDGREVEMGEMETIVKLELDDGSHSLELMVFDLCGHTTYLKHEFKIDTRAPKIRIDDMKTTVQGLKIDLYFTVDEDASEILPLEIKLDDGEYVEQNNNRVFSSEELEPGLHVVTLKATDEAGNVYEEKYHFEISKDTIGSSAPEGNGSGLLVIVGVAGMLMILAGLSTMIFLKKRKANAKDKLPGNETLSSVVKRPQDRMTLPAPVTPLADNRLLPPAAGYVETVQGVVYHRPDHK